MYRRLLVKEEKIYIGNIYANRMFKGIDGNIFHSLICDYRTSNGLKKQKAYVSLSSKDYENVQRFGYYYRVNVN